MLKYAMNPIQNTQFWAVVEMNKKTIALTEEQYGKIIKIIRSGFICKDGHMVKPNNRIATALSLEANLGLRISDI